MSKKRPKARASGINRRRDWRPVFLEQLAQTGNVKLAADAAQVGRTTAYRHRDEDKDFAEGWDRAMDDAMDLLEAEARRRAVEGVNEPVIYEGKLQGVWVDANGQTVTEKTPGATLIPLTVKKYSDTLLIFLMKGANPRKYRETHHHVHDGNIGLRTVAEGTAEADALLSELQQRFGVNGDGAPAH